MFLDRFIFLCVGPNASWSFGLDLGRVVNQERLQLETLRKEEVSDVVAPDCDVV